jgi:hypothetical protein
MVVPEADTMFGYGIAEIVPVLQEAWDRLEASPVIFGYALTGNGVLTIERVADSSNAAVQVATPSQSSLHSDLYINSLEGDPPSWYNYELQYYRLVRRNNRYPWPVLPGFVAGVTTGGSPDPYKGGLHLETQDGTVVYQGADPYFIDRTVTPKIQIGPRPNQFYLYRVYALWKASIDGTDTYYWVTSETESTCSAWSGNVSQVS